MDKRLKCKLLTKGPEFRKTNNPLFLRDIVNLNMVNQEKQHNVGHGKAIAKKILELHDANICVKSHLNEGTTFLFQSPA